MTEQKWNLYRRARASTVDVTGPGIGERLEESRAFMRTPIVGDVRPIISYPFDSCLPEVLMINKKRTIERFGDPFFVSDVLY